MVYDLQASAHSVFLLNYHLILVVKYRRSVFDDAMSEVAKETFTNIATDYGIEVDTWNHDGDHIHVLFRATPTTELAKFINAYKSASSRVLKKPPLCSTCTKFIYTIILASLCKK